MKWLLRGTLPVLALVGVAGIFGLLVWFANEWVVSSLASTAVLAWMAGWLVIAYGRGRVRAAAIGAVVAGTAYWLLVFGPWFQGHIGSTLLTSRLLVWVEATHRQPVQAAAPAGVFTTIDLGGDGYVASNTILSGSQVLTTTPQYVVTTIPPAAPQPSPGMSAFQSAGHWSFAWLFALAGGILAAVLSRHRKDWCEKQEAAS